MCELIEYIKTNISWIKDIITIIFVSTATIIAILTYKRAKATILQPLRSETIKKQSALFSEILEFLSNNKNEVDRGLDYMGVTMASTYKLLDELGFKFSNHPDINKTFQKEITGFLYVGESEIIRDVTVLQTFSSKKAKLKEDIGKIKYKEYKEGKYDIDKIFLTKKHSAFTNRLSELVDNPFLPESIQNVLKELQRDIRENLSIRLRNTLSEFLEDFRKKYETQKKILKIEFRGVYNEFNHKKINHKERLEKINSVIRSFLLIDSKW